MPITIAELVEELIPENTVLLLGAGASIPSGAPSAPALASGLSQIFKLGEGDLNLRDASSLVEVRRDRSDLIRYIRGKFNGLRAKGAILNLPHYAWKSIFTTNYDALVEDAYDRAGKVLKPFSSNFDFTADAPLGATNLFKIHGTLDKDIVDGNVSRLILTDTDYDLTEDYREALYDRMRSEMDPGSSVLIVGQSLADSDIRDLVQRAIQINQRANRKGRISLLLYEADQNRAQLLEARGVRVSFGSLDDFVAALGRRQPTIPVADALKDEPLDKVIALRPVTHIVGEECAPEKANASAIFNGWPANYPEIVSGLTFERTSSIEISSYLQSELKTCAIILGASGVGKTTAGRQAVLKLRQQGFSAWEHKGDHPLSAAHWLEVAHHLRLQSKKGVLFIDDAHSHLFSLNELIDRLAAAQYTHLKIIVASSRNHWGPRVKTPNIYQCGKEFPMILLDHQEIDRLIVLVDSVPELRTLVEAGFAGFNAYEKRRRMIDRCHADMFVCLKNIFASEKFDDIVLREYAALAEESQDIYKFVSAMEHAGVNVHRQLVVRTLGISAGAIQSVLASLDEIINEYVVSTRDGVYGWKVRHYVIAGIIAKYKFYEQSQRVELFQRVIDNISPTYDIEIRTIRELCNMESGIPSIPDKHVQNTLLRQMMSVAPGERVPRHRLIRNLISLGEYEKAESEIRIFEKDFRREAPIARYRILLTIARAVHTPGLMREDRVTILSQARDQVIIALERYESNKYILSAYCELGVEYFRITGSHEVFDDAMVRLQKAEARLGDPDVTKMVVKYQRIISGQLGSVDEPEEALGE